MVAPVSNRENVLFLLTVMGKFAAYLTMLNLTSILLSAHDSHSEPDEESKLLSGAVRVMGSSISSGSDSVFLDTHFVQ